MGMGLKFVEGFWVAIAFTLDRLTCVCVQMEQLADSADLVLCLRKMSLSIVLCG